MTEFELIHRFFSGLDFGPSTRLGIGDDAAILDIPPAHSLVVSVDSANEHTHFSELTLPEVVAYRSIASAISDLAAMGATPIGMTLALSLSEQDPLWLRSFSEGVTKAVYAFGCPLVGGDTTKGPLSISVTVMGTVPQGFGLKRSGATVGDLICVSSSLGDAAAGLQLELGTLFAEEHPSCSDYLLDRWSYPQPRLALGSDLLNSATACIDISDGFLADLGHLLQQSGVGAQINEAAIPMSAELISVVGRAQALQLALSGGEDYELCFTLPSSVAVPEGCSVVGQIVATMGIHGLTNTPVRTGFQHF